MATNILLTVQTGMAARDLIRCGPLSRVLEHPDARVVLLTPGSRDPAFLVEVRHERVVVLPQRPYAPSTMLWRLMVRRWRHARTPAMANAIHGWEEKLIPSAYEDVFAVYPPSLVVSGDPLRPGDANLVAQAHRAGVPSLGSVRSWDNVLKHLRTRADRVTVWNPRNAREAEETDRYAADRIEVVGAPQLDLYSRPDEWQCSREELCAEMGLDPNKRIVLLATSSFTYESDQTYLVDMLLEALRSGEIRQPAQIVLRLHPADLAGRYMKYRYAPEVVLDVPETYYATLGWTQTEHDMQRMARLLQHSDAMVNFATTVTVECAIFDVPTLLVAFSPIDPEEMRRYVLEQHFTMHYKPLVDRNLVPVAWSREHVVSWLNVYLEDRSLYRAERATIAREWAPFADGCSARRLGDAILRAAGLEPPDAWPEAAPAQAALARS